METTKLKTLYSEGRLLELLEETRGKEDPESIFYAISAYLGLNQADSGLALLLKHRQSLYKQKPMLTIKTDFELRFALKQFDEAYEDLSFFENEPYMSQEVEETLRALPKMIREQEKGASLSKSYSQDEIEKMLSSPNDFEVLSALAHLGRAGVYPFMEEVENICSSSRHHDLKAFALEILIKEKDPRKIKFVTKEGELELMPSLMTSPYQNEGFLETAKSLFSYSKDPSLCEIARSLLDQIALSAFPSYPFMEGKIEERVKALFLLAASYLEGKKVEAKGDLPSSLAKKYEQILIDNPPISE